MMPVVGNLLPLFVRLMMMMLWLLLWKRMYRLRSIVGLWLVEPSYSVKLKILEQLNFYFLTMCQLTASWLASDPSGNRSNTPINNSTHSTIQPNNGHSTQSIKSICVCICLCFYPCTHTNVQNHNTHRPKQQQSRL